MSLDSPQTIAGRVVHVSRFNRRFHILHVFSDNQFTTVVVKDQAVRVRNGDYIIAEARLVSFRDTLEWHASALTVSCRRSGANARRPSVRGQMSPARLELVAARLTAVDGIEASVRASGFRRVHSPTLAGPWAQGRTIPFSVDFYGTRRFLSISNMVYHHIILGHGYPRIYELDQLHRHETPSDKWKLAEYTALEIGAATADLSTVMEAIEQAIRAAHEAVAAMGLRLHAVPERIAFERVDYRDVLAGAGIARTSGSQLPSAAARWLGRTFTSFVWVTGFPEWTRPFYTKAIGGVCDDCQLWFRGERYFAAGGVVETDYDRVVEKLKAKKMRPEAFDFYLDHLASGWPPMVGIGMGMELFLSSMISDSAAADFAWFPRYQRYSGTD